MPDLQEFLDAAAKITISVRPGAGGRDTLHSIDFFANAETLRAGAIYLLTEAELPALSARAPLPAAVFFVACAADAPPLPLPALPENCTVVFVRSELLPLYTLLNGVLSGLRSRRRINDVFRMGENMQYSPEQMVHAASEMLGVGIYLLDASFHLICGNTAGAPEGIALAEELERGGALSPESVRRIRGGKAGDTVLLYDAGSAPFSKFHILMLWNEVRRYEAPYLCERLADFVVRCHSRSAPPEIPPFLIDRRLNRVLEGKITDDQEICGVFDIRSDGDAWFAVLVLRSGPQMRWNSETYQRNVQLLRSAFRDTLITVVRDHVCAVVRLPLESPRSASYSRSLFDEYAYAEGWNAARLEQELKRFGVYLCRSTVFHYVHMAAVKFSLAVDALDIAIKLDGCRGRHIVDYHDYNYYVSLKFALERFLQQFEPRNLKALLHPELATLLIHDSKTGSDLASVLYTYYIYSDVQRTAQALFVHRNTIYNKLKTIQKILGADLDDPVNRNHYFTSLMIYFYCEKCLGLDMQKLLSPRT